MSAVMTILLIVLIAYQPALPTPSDTGLALRQGVAFLKAQYDQELGLLRESPNVGRNRYYLTNDNVLATYALETLKAEPELAKTLRASLHRYQHEANGLIEIAWGQYIDWPPAVPVDDLVLQQGADTVLNESHYGKARYQDWADYANLSFMYCLYRLRTTNRSLALADYSQAMQLFDGTGFADKAYQAGR
jgi:hypothetical protein